MRQFYILFIVLLSIPFFGLSQTFTTIAEDNASNYTNPPTFSLSVSDNGGSGFNAWTWSDSGSNRSAFPGWGPNDGHGDIGNPSFGLFAQNDGSAINAFRKFTTPLEVGDIFSVEFTINYRAGNKGVEIYQNGTGVFLFQSSDVGGDKYEYRDPANNFTDTGWPYQANSIFRLTVEQVSNTNVTITVERTNSIGHSVTLTNENVSGSIDEIRFFNSNAGGGSQNFYFNNLLIQRPTFTTIADGNVNDSATWTNGDIPDGTGRVVINHEVSIAENQDLVASNLELGVNGNLILNSISNNYSSLIVDHVIGSGTVTYNRSVNSYTDDATNNDNDLISAPVTGQAFGSFATANTNLLASGIERAFAPFNNTTGSGAYENYDTTDNAATLITPATGYRAATTDGGTLSFTGTVQTGDVSIDISTPGGGSIWNLIGNPYPSYIDAEAFLTHVVSTATSGEQNIHLLDNASCIYGYDGDASDGWTVITLANDAGQLIAPGQGFFVAADSNDVSAHNIEFTTAMRSTGSSDDFIAGRSSQLTYLKLNAATANHSYNTEFYFDADASLGLDPGYDAQIWGGTAPSFALYSNLVQDNTGMPIALQALNTTDMTNVVIPLGVNAFAGEQLTFIISETTLPSTVEVYLDDTLNNTTTLLNTSDYVINPISDITGTGRFYIRFAQQALSTTDVDFDAIKIYTSTTPRALYVHGVLQGETTAKVYDLQGRLVHHSVLNSNNLVNQIDASDFSDGVYVVTLSNGVQEKSQKVIIR
ncbi:MAG: hypothetical protein CMC68_03905 [Flavobacteriaceae bacterium]|nr:hypothetical protein [Flavobacteriaceae bacterium]